MVSPSDDLGAAELQQGLGDPRDVVVGDGALERAAEHGGHVAADAQPGVGGAVDDRGEHRQRLVDGAVEVALRERLGRGAEDRDLGHAGLQRTVQAGLVRHQHRVAHALDRGDAGQHVGRVRELGDPLRVHEGGGLDHGQPRGGQPVDEPDLDVGGHHAGFVLQPVARADLDDRHGIGQRHVMRPRARRGHLDQRRPGLHGIPGGDVQCRDGPVDGGGDRVLHLHGLDQQQHLAGRHRVTLGDPDLQDRPRHRRRERPDAPDGGRVGVVGRPGMAQPQGAPADVGPHLLVLDGDDQRYGGAVHGHGRAPRGVRVVGEHHVVHRAVVHGDCQAVGPATHPHEVLHVTVDQPDRGPAGRADPPGADPVPRADRVAGLGFVAAGAVVGEHRRHGDQVDLGRWCRPPVGQVAVEEAGVDLAGGERRVGDHVGEVVEVGPHAVQHGAGQQRSACGRRRRRGPRRARPAWPASGRRSAGRRCPSWTPLSTRIPGPDGTS